ncbi:MAG: hypothetical protein UV68_C0036G0021 [Candidatus Collierbacteria bacterium GW2011_GWC2_43_12]|uniref:DUF1059 domain-containing protein n=1 Tax=Candidatus Collierbacteria bacterium GW2011_GWC2_43_12 TaxID=1618390 RepID=A0A0G1D4Y7_9BACT|nr:MAG: hypothetical protein UV68_C0036G0021 [Candidatus Collierbacteria bacterium GW2011_GWC2_43_12]KKT83555.1 MAG: hypothetical protein UW80_C0011G0003 [Microgenomates group bacterium GW2011_GWC1_44_9]
MGKYTCKCIVPGCSKLFLVDAASENKAIDEILMEGESHNFEDHSEMPILSEEKIKSLVVKGIKKV